MALPTYPTSLDPEVWQVVLDALRGSFPKPQHAVHCLYAAEGYCLEQFYPDSDIIVGGEKIRQTLLVAAGNYSKSEAEAVLAGLASGGNKALKINWAALFQVILKILPLVLPFLDPVPAV